MSLTMLSLVSRAFSTVSSGRSIWLGVQLTKLALANRVANRVADRAATPGGRISARFSSRLPFALLVATMLLAAPYTAHSQPKPDGPPPYSIKENYTKYEYRVPMRDGKKLFTTVYAPKDSAKPAPFLMVRTPYSVAPYGVDQYRESLGPSTEFDRAGYIFVFQDVRGRYMSEGAFIDMTPHKTKKSGTDVDESTDMFDSAEWLLKNIPHNNGRIGLWGISYPGFYVSASIIDSHPAIKAASPQAPVTDMYMNDDSYHNGAFMLAANFGFYTGFKRQENPTVKPNKWDPYEYGTKDGYEYFLGLGTLANLNSKIDKPEYVMWKDNITNDTYNDFWQSRNIAAHLKNIKASVLTVGGWFDAEDPQGPLTTYRSIKASNPGIYNGLVMGPWVHGGWARNDGERIGMVNFAAKTSEYYQKKIVFPFFEKNLRPAAANDPKLPGAKPAEPFAEAHVFETGTNIWRQYPQWPPAEAKPKMLYFGAQGKLTWTQPGSPQGGAQGNASTYDEYVSDPAKPVPFIAYTATGVPQEYMVGDQRFASTRTDVLTYSTDVLEEDITIAGPIMPKLFVSTSGSDSDWVVKLIDVYPAELPDEKPDNAARPKDAPGPKIQLSGYQQLVRGEPFRGKFRNGFVTPQPFTPGKVEAVNFTMPDVLHTFRRGHRIMVQVQSSWFPLVDRNPQVYMRIPDAKPEDFKTATQRIYRSGATFSGISVGVMGFGHASTMTGSRASQSSK